MPAHALKAVNNALLALHIWSTAEGLVAAMKAGVAPQIALDVINASSGRSNASMNLFPERVLTGAFPRTFRLALLDKDAGIAAAMARSQKSPSPALQLAADLMRIAHLELGDEVDHVEAVTLVERWAGSPAPLVMRTPSTRPALRRVDAPRLLAIAACRRQRPGTGRVPARLGRFDRLGARIS